MKSVIELRAAIDREPAKSAWARGVKDYAQGMLDDLTEWRGLKDLNDEVEPITERELLNGAENWKGFSWGGCSFIYDADIARKLCSPSELKKTNDGERKPNAGEEWLDVQARALFQAAQMLLRLANE
jgi:hypothetical protein